MEVKFTIVWCFSGASTVSQRNAWRRSTELTSTLSIPEQHRWWKLEKDIYIGWSGKEEKLKKWLSSIFHLRLLLIFAKWVSTKQVELYNFLIAQVLLEYNLFFLNQLWLNLFRISATRAVYEASSSRIRELRGSIPAQDKDTQQGAVGRLLMIMPILKQRLSHCVVSQHHYSPKFSFGYWWLLMH